MGVSGGCESTATGARLKSEEARAKGLQKGLVFLDLTNGHNAYKRTAARRSPEALAATELSMRSLVLAHHSIFSQNNPIYVSSSQTETGIKYLCESSAGGGKSNPLANIVFPVVIEKALMAAEPNGVEPRAQQDDTHLWRDPDETPVADGTL